MSNESKAEYDYYCPNCEEEVEKDTAECNLCGYPIAEHGGSKQVKKPIKIPELPYQALSTRGKIWYYLAGKYYWQFNWIQKVLFQTVILFIVLTLLYLPRCINYFLENIVPHLDDEVYWVEKLDGTVEFLTIPDGCGPIIEKLAQDEEMTDIEITKLRNTIPIEDASLLYSALRRTWYTENGYTNTLVLDMLILTDVVNFETKVYYPTEHDILD